MYELHKADIRPIDTCKPHWHILRPPLKMLHLPESRKLLRRHGNSKCHWIRTLAAEFAVRLEDIVHLQACSQHIDSLGMYAWQLKIEGLDQMPSLLRQPAHQTVHWPPPGGGGDANAWRLAGPRTLASTSYASVQGQAAAWREASNLDISPSFIVRPKHCQ